MFGINDRLNYQSKAMYSKFKRDLSIVYEIKDYELAESFLYLNLVLQDWKTKSKVSLYGLQSHMR